MTTETAKKSLNAIVLAMAAPLILQNISQTLLGVIDTWFVSKLGSTEVAAVGLAGIIQFTFLVMFQATVRSIVALVGRAHGANDHKKIGDIVWRGFSVAALLSVSLLVLPWLLRSLTELASPTPDVAALGVTYISIRVFETPFVMFSAVVWAFLVGRGDSRTPMLIMWAMVAVNVFLDWVLVLGNLGMPALGVAGAAYATILANVFNVTISAFVLWSRHNRETYHTGSPRLATWTDVKNTLALGIPAGLGDFIEIASFSLFFAMIGQISTEALAANNIAVQYMSLSFTVGVAFSMTASSLVSQYVGSEDLDMAERAANRAIVFAVLVMGGIGLSYLIAPARLMGVFSADPLVIEAGVTILRLIAVYQVFDAAGIVLAGALLGGGDTRFTMLSRLLLAWGFFMPLTYAMIFVWDQGVWGGWIAALTYLVLLAFVYAWRFRRGTWKTLEVV